MVKSNINRQLLDSNEAIVLSLAEMEFRQSLMKSVNLTLNTSFQLRLYYSYSLECVSVVIQHQLYFTFVYSNELCFIIIIIVIIILTIIISILNNNTNNDIINIKITVILFLLLSLLLLVLLLCIVLFL